MHGSLACLRLVAARLERCSSSPVVLLLGCWNVRGLFVFSVCWVVLLLGAFGDLRHSGLGGSALKGVWWVAVIVLAPASATT